MRTCRARSVSSDPGDTPDLDASPDVFTWMWMRRGVVMGGEDWARTARPESRAVAFLVVSTEETQNRLGTCDAKGLHLSRGYVSWRFYSFEEVDWI